MDAAWQRLRGRTRRSASAESRPETPVVPLHQPRRWNVWRVASSAVVLLGLGWLGYRLAVPPAVPLVPVEVASGNAPREITLPDGSRVLLNRASRLRYAAGFSGEIRLVALTGEAFFDVKRNPQRPFVIEAAGTEVRGLGTSFNVPVATPDAAVTVATGTVRFSGKEAQNRRTGVVLT